MFIKRARARPSVRARGVDDDEPQPGSPLAQSVTGGDAEPEAESAAGSIMERKKAQRKGKAGKASKLSFGGEAEASDTSALKQKKSLLSLALKAGSPMPSTPAASSSPSYSQEYLSELKAATPTRAPQEKDIEDVNGLSQIARDKYSTTIVEDSTAGIPDPVAIAAAKSKRKAMLEAKRMGINPEEEDYISLGGDKGPHPESRLMREEDEGEDGDEDLADYTGANDRLYLGKGANKAAARRLKGEIGEMIAEHEDESESDEETREWERTLVSRGGNTLPEAKEDKTKKRAYVPTPKLEAVKLENENNLQNATTDLVLLEEQERDVRKQVMEVEAKREWVEGFQEWVETLGRFLEEKNPKLDEIEKDAYKFIEERKAMVAPRQVGDDSDDLALFMGIASVVPVDGKPVNEANESAANSDLRRIRRIARQDRRQRREGLVAAAEREEGFSTDSDLEQDVEDDYSAAQHDLRRRVASLFEDVKAEDFKDPEKGLAVQFADWRTRYPDDYNGAFGGLSLVQAWEFWARGEMIGWDPLRSDTRLESFQWFTALYNYSRPRVTDDDDEDGMDLEPEVGPEGDLAAEMVSKAVVPLLIKAVEAGAYDPCSAPQTRRAVDLADVVAELTGSDSKKSKSFVKAILGVYQTHIFELAGAVASAGGPASQRPPPYNPAARSAMFRYVRRRLKLIRNLLLWRRTAPAEVRDLVARVVSVVLRPILAKTWEGGGEDMAKRVLEVAGSHLPPNLVEFLQAGPRR